MVYLTTVEKIGRDRSKDNHCPCLLLLTVAKTMTKSDWGAGGGGGFILSHNLQSFTEGSQREDPEAGTEGRPENTAD